MTDKVEQIRQEIERRYNLNRIGAHSAFRNGKCEALREVLDFIDSLPNEPKDKCQGCNNVKGCITCVDGSEWAHSVSEELEDELDSYIKDNFTIDKEQLDRFGLDEKDYMYSMDKSDMLAMVRHFTELQHKKDVVITKDLIATAFANGMADMKQQMMKDAVDGRFSYNPNFKENEFICLEKSDTPEHYLGELVKVIIIKQEEE